MIKRRHAGYILLFVVFGACTTFNSPEPVPSYLEISNFKLSTDADMGISDAWVYVNNEFVGVFGLPAKVPVLQWEAVNVVLKPGVKFNGIASTRGIYHFYNEFTGSYQLNPGQTVFIKPQTAYNDSWVSRVYTEDFERTLSTFEYPSYSDTVLVSTTTDKFMGKYSGAVWLNTSHQTFECFCYPGNTDWFTTPSAIKQAGLFFELNYKTNNEFTVGLIIPASETKKIPLITFNKSDSWKKAYVDLHSYLQLYPASTKYRVYLASSLPTGQTEACILLDNLRIVQ